MAVSAQQAHKPKITVLAAGSLREPMNDVGEAYRKAAGTSIVVSHGPSHKLREEIEHGRKADVFASAATEHTETLFAKGLLAGSAVFAYNDLCVVARPEVGLNEGNLLEGLLQPSVRLATSTPVSDPMGDYTWQFFRNANQRQSGGFKAFDAEALKLFGTTAPVPGQKLPYVTAFEEGKADAYIMYCTNAVSTRRALPALSVLRIPRSLNVCSAYGIGAAPSSTDGAHFVSFVLSPAGTAILRRHGFD